MLTKLSVSFITADSDAVFTTRVATIVTSLDGNRPYISLAPLLPPITTANSDFAEAMAAAADGGKRFTSAKNQKRSVLELLMRGLANGVQGACDNDMTILLSSSFPVQKPDRKKASVPATPSAPKVLQKLTGEVWLTTTPVESTYIYNWRVALASAPEVYVQHLQSTGAMRVSVKGLTPGELYRFQCNAVGTAGTSDWSNAGTMIVI